jgi:hypothetical protein
MARALPEGVEEWYTKFKDDLDSEKAQTSEDHAERLHRIEMELTAIKLGNIPPTRIFDAIRSHTIMKLSEGDDETMINALEVTAERQPIQLNFLLLWAVCRVLGRDEKAAQLVDKVGLPQK